jgi:hypothetical protein
LPRPGRREGRRNTGDSSAGDQTIARGIGGIIAVHFANVFDAAHVSDQGRHARNQLLAVFRDDPRVRLQHLVHELPAADAVIVGERGPRQAVQCQHIAELFRYGSFGGAMRKRIRRKKHVADVFAAAALSNSLRQHPRR